MDDLIFVRPLGMAEACDCLLANKNARILAGGTDLILAMERKKIRPTHIIDISSITGIDGIFMKNGFLHLGAMASIQSIRDSKQVGGEFPALAEAAGSLGCWQVRNRATLGGNLANAAPSAEMAPPLMALGARLKLLGPDGERILPIEEFFRGPGETALGPGEILEEVMVPRPPAGTKMIYLRHSLRRSMDIALVNAALCFLYEGNAARHVRVALGAVAPTPVRARKAEQALEGKTLNGLLIDKAAEIAAGECRPITDIRATAGYRREMAGVLVRRGLTALFERVVGK